MISLFKDRSAASVFWLIIVCFALHTNSLLSPAQVVIAPADGFFYYILQPLQNAQPYFVSLLYMLLIFLCALQLNFILTSLRLYPRPSYTAALAFIIFSALLPQFNVVSTALFACNFFIWILYSACKLYAAPNPKTSIYNLGLLCGLCIVLYYPSLPLILIALLALIVIRPLRLNELFVLFFGIITPAYFIVSWFFITDRLGMLPQPQEIFHLITFPVLPVVTIATLATAAVATVWGMLLVQNSGANVLIQVRKSWTIFFIAFAGMMPVIYFVTGAWPLVLLLAMIPAAAYTGFAFAGSRSIMSLIFFWLLVGFAVYNNWFANH